jgi:DUF971 family protein
MSLKIEDMQLFPMGLAIKWNDDSDSLLPYEKLRTLCPCAHCSGETDVFGNVYKGPDETLPTNAFQLVNVVKVGHYAIRISWGDGHNTGIFSYEMLREMEKMKDA